jgi:hypothetical protein
MVTHDWYMLRTRPGFETVACRWVEGVMGGVAYSPISRHAPRPAMGGSVVVEASGALTGWVLARFESMPDWRLLEGCETASPRLFMVFSHEIVIDHETGRKEAVYAPWMMRAADVEALQAREAAGGFDWQPEVTLAEKLVGTWIRLQSGPFMGKRARVRHVADDTCHCGIRMLGKWVNLSVQLEHAIAGSPLFRT